MSDNSTSDTKNTCFSTISKNTLTLSDFSERDKPWDKHRANAEKIEGFYRNSEFQKYADRMKLCSEVLSFILVPNEGELKLKLNNARFCRVRHCPICQWRRSLMWKAKAYKILPKIQEIYPKYRWLFVTLTIRNCEIKELRLHLKWMNESFKRLTKLKDFPADGWLKSIEVTRSNQGEAHPHFHCLLLVKPSYFSHGYLSQKSWCKLWQKCLRINYQPILDIKVVKKDTSPKSLIPELLKYCTKESDMTADKEWLLELTRQMKNVRCISTGGILKLYLSKLENEPDDLIGHGKESSEIKKDYFYFEWKRSAKKYKLTNS